jgi:sugar phosphate isomerase/epimerase
MIPLTCPDYTFPLLVPAQRFALLRLLGFNYVDIGLFERSEGLRPGQLLAEPRKFTQQLRDDLRSSELQVSDIFLQTGADPSEPAANDSSALVRARNHKAFLATLDLCSSLGCMHLTGLPGVRHKTAAEADDHALAREEAAWRVRIAAGAGVVYAIESHVGSLCSDVEFTRSFVASVSGLTLKLDYGRFIFTNTPSRGIHTLLPFASHIHVRGGAHSHETHRHAGRGCRSRSFSCQPR